MTGEAQVARILVGQDQRMGLNALQRRVLMGGADGRGRQGEGGPPAIRLWGESGSVDEGMQAYSRRSVRQRATRGSEGQRRRVNERGSLAHT